MHPRILVVEDDVELAAMVAELLLGAGYEALVAHGVDEALERLERDTPCVVLLDLKLEANPAWVRAGAGRIPVVLFSGSDQLQSERARLRAEGAVPKPVDAGVLLARIAEQVEEARRRGIPCESWRGIPTN